MRIPVVFCCFQVTPTASRLPGMQRGFAGQVIKYSPREDSGCCGIDLWLKSVLLRSLQHLLHRCCTGGRGEAASAGSSRQLRLGSLESLDDLLSHMGGSHRKLRSWISPVVRTATVPRRWLAAPVRLDGPFTALRCQLRRLALCFLTSGLAAGLHCCGIFTGNFYHLGL